jgi:hypothetical protein
MEAAHADLASVYHRPDGVEACAVVVTLVLAMVDELPG